MHWNTMGWPWVVGKIPLTIIMVEGTAGLLAGLLMRKWLRPAGCFWWSMASCALVLCVGNHTHSYISFNHYSFASIDAGAEMRDVGAGL